MCFGIFSGSGVLMWEVYSEGRLPYECRSNAEVVESLNAGLRLLKPRLCPEPVYQLMHWCWKEVCEQISVMSSIDTAILWKLFPRMLCLSKITHKFYSDIGV